MVASGRSTISEVAKRAGVSISAVSRFLGGTLNLPEETADRIRDAVRDLNYAPHASARRLRFGRSETLGFVAPEISNPFFALMGSAIASRAWEMGLDLLVWNTSDVIEREIASVKRLRDSYIDGLLFITHHRTDKSLIEQLRGAGPTVFIDEDVADIPGSRIFVENERGGRLATKTLIEMGHVNVAHVGSPATLMSAELRHAGWRKAMAEFDLPIPDAYYMSGPIEPDFGRAALAALMKLPVPPSAIFVGADAIALGIISASREMGLHIPRDLSIISFDGLPVGELLDPPLTTVVQPIQEMGRKGVDLLVKRIKYPDTPAEHIILPVSLEIRASAAPPRAARKKRR